MFMKEDYIMRTIRQITLVLARILGLKNKKRYEEGLQITNETLKKYIGLDSKTVDLLSYKDLIKMISYGNDIDISKGIALCEMLTVEGDIYALQNCFLESYSRYLKSLNIYIKMIMENNTGYDLTSYIHKIEDIVTKLKGYKLSVEVQLNLFNYYETIGKYSKAEDIIFELLEDDIESKKEIVNIAIAFYKRLSNKPKEDLINGNLPIDEVYESRAELEGKYL